MLSLAALILSAKNKAVPLGLSIFLLWCVSIISISVSGNSFAKEATILAIKFISYDILADLKIGISFE